MKKTAIKDGYELSRRMYILHAALSYFISIITTGAYLAKLTTTIGISDEMTAVLGAISSLSGVFQILSVPLSSRSRAKGMVSSFVLVHHLLYAFLYLIPFLNLPAGGSSAVFFVCMLTATVILQICSPLKFNWFMSLVPGRGRPAFQSAVQIFSHITGLAFSFAASWLIDRFDRSGNTKAMFLTFATVVLVISICDFLTLVSSKEKERAPVARKSVLADFSSVMGNRGFVLYMIMFLLHSVGTNISGPFLGTYQIKELGLSMVQVSVFSAVTVVVSVSALAVFGRLSKHRGMKGIMLAGLVISASAYLMVSLAAPGRGFVFFILYYAIHAIGESATSIGISTMVMDIVAPDQCVSAMAIRSVVVGPAAFAVTIAMTPFLNFVQARGNELFGMTVYAQQLMGIMSFVVIMAAAGVYRIFSKKYERGAE